MQRREKHKVRAPISTIRAWLNSRLPLPLISHADVDTDTHTHMASTRNFWTERHIHMDGRMEGWTDGPEKKLVKFTYTDTKEI